jgi:hypothetical protein
MPDPAVWAPLAAATVGLDRSTPSLPARLDPYLLWADASGALDVAAGKARGIQVALEWSGGVPPPGVDAAVSAGEMHYGTALVDAAGLRALLSAPGVRRVELGSAPATSDAHPAPPIADVDRLPGPVVAVIDAGCAFAHERFRYRDTDGRWRTRIRALWDQNTGDAHPRGSEWRAPAGRRYGRELDDRAIDALLATHASGADIDEAAIYRACGCATELAPPVVHGTHVADLAAGVRPSKDDASRADILFVHLPHFAVADTSGASMVGPLADALGWILERVADDAVLVVNLSYGSMAGPHDGSTLVERMLDAVAEGGSRRAVVLPAGNNHEADAHAAFALDAARPGVTLQWEVMVGDATDSFLELWYPRAQAGRVRVTLHPPGGPPCTVEVDQWQGWPADGGLRAAAIHLREACAGDDDAMVLLALAPTGRRPGDCGSRPLAPAGVWQVEVALDAADVGAPVPIWAWIERDDPAPDRTTAARQSRLLTNRLPGQPDQPGDPVTRRGTGNSIANGRSTFVAAGCVGTTADAPPARYSSAGPTRNTLRRQLDWPSAAVPCEASSALRGIAAAGTRSGATVRMNGTSVAAPQLARWLLNALVQPRTRASLAARLREAVVGGGVPDRIGPGRLPLP